MRCCRRILLLLLLVACGTTAVAFAALLGARANVNHSDRLDISGGGTGTGIPPMGATTPPHH